MIFKNRKTSKKFQSIYEGISALRDTGLNETQIAQLVRLRLYYNPDFDNLSVRDNFLDILHRQRQLLEDTTVSLAFAYGCPMIFRPPERLRA